MIRCINTRGRTKEALGWGAVFAFIFIAQAVDALMFNNQLQHLTNWGWLFHGVVAAARMCSPKTPQVLTLLAFSVSVFVAAGIACIRIMDDTFIRAFEKDLGVAVVTTADLVFHWLPALFWTGVLLCDYLATREWYRVMPTVASLAQTNLVPLMVAAAYGLIFDPQKQYPGDNIHFDVLFVASAASVAMANAFVILHGVDA